MHPSIYEIATIGRGVLYVMPKPSAEWLDDDMRAYRALGIARIVSLLEVAEASELGLALEELHCRRHEMEFSQMSIRDRGLPSAADLKRLVNFTHGALGDGMNVAIHCRAGIGRSGLLASCILIKDGMTAEEAIKVVSSGRGVQIPETAEQSAFILDYSP